jgi:hypothetical protein
MEAVAYVAGRDWGDAPPCVDPVLGSFMRAWNDGLPTDADRDRLLKPFIPKLIGTKFDEALEQRRAFMAMDWVIRVCTPKFLDLVPALASHALALRNLEEIADAAGLLAAGEKLSAARKASAAAWDAAWDATWAAAWAATWDAAWAAAWAATWAAAWDAARAAARAAARDAAWAAAWAAAWDAAWDAAWAAARDAAWAAARDAARDAAWAAARAAAWDAAWDAAWAAARDAAWDAARDAARAAAGNFLKPTVEWLQVSAVDLVNRMIEAGPETEVTEQAACLP